MKKRELATLAMVGISAALMLGGCQKSGSHSAGNKAADETMNPDMQSFYNTLSQDAQKKFQELDAQHKMMAIEMAQQSCNGKNKCAGMGGCSTAQHDCSGKNSCKGQGGPAVKDPNKAVDTQYNNQVQQRQKANSGMSGK